MEKINGDVEIYTFEYIVAQQDFPKAYGRKFVVLEKYNELQQQVQDMTAALAFINPELKKVADAYATLESKCEKLLKCVKTIYKEDHGEDAPWFVAQGCLHEIKEIE